MVPGVEGGPDMIWILAGVVVASGVAGWLALNRIYRRRARGWYVALIVTVVIFGSAVALMLRATGTAK